MWTWLSGLLGGLSTDEVSALASAISAGAGTVTVVLAIVAAIYAAVQLRDARRLRREQAAPYVVVQFDQSQGSSRIIDFVIRNIGATPAFDVKLTIAPPMERATPIPDYPFMDARPIANGLKMLAPGQEVRMLFDDLAERSKTALPNEFEVVVTGKDSRMRKLEKATYDLDIDWGRGSVGVDVYNLHRIGKRVEGIDASLTSIAAALTDRKLS